MDKYNRSFQICKEVFIDRKSNFRCLLLSYLLYCFRFVSHSEISVMDFSMFLQIIQKSLTTFLYIFISFIKISCIPRIRNIPS